MIILRVRAKIRKNKHVRVYALLTRVYSPTPPPSFARSFDAFALSKFSIFAPFLLNARGETLLFSS